MSSYLIRRWLGIRLDRDRDNRMEDEEEEATFRSVDSFEGHSEFGNGN